MSGRGLFIKIFSKLFIINPIKRIKEKRNPSLLWFFSISKKMIIKDAIIRKFPLPKKLITVIISVKSGFLKLNIKEDIIASKLTSPFWKTSRPIFTNIKKEKRLKKIPIIISKKIIKEGLELIANNKTSFTFL